VACVIAAAKSRNTRLPVTSGGASKCFRYTHTRSQADGSQFCQDSGATVCGNVTVAKALSSKPGSLLPAEAEPKSQPVLNETSTEEPLLTHAHARGGRGLRLRGGLSRRPRGRHQDVQRGPCGQPRRSAYCGTQEPAPPHQCGLTVIRAKLRVVHAFQTSGRAPD
jgi:hypothetical protein